MMRNVNQVCGVVALIAVGCLAGFDSAGERIVSAAPGQIEPAGDTGQAIAIGGCNRCAWSFRAISQTNILPGSEVVVFPRGTSGVVRFASVYGFLPQGTSWAPTIPSDCFETGAIGETTISPLVIQIEEGVKFVDGLILRYNEPNQPFNIAATVYYRLD